MDGIKEMLQLILMEIQQIKKDVNNIQGYLGMPEYDEKEKINNV